jgi:hypothetical protein
VFRSFMGAGSPLFSWLFPCWCRPKALSPEVSSPPILFVEQRHHAPKFQLFPLVTCRQCLSVTSYLGAPTGTAGQGLVRVPSVRSCWGSVRSCRGSVRSSLGSARSLSDHVGSLSDHHLAQRDLYPIVSGLCPIVIWLIQISVRSCQISVRSSFGSVWSLSNRAGSLSDHYFALPPSSCSVSLARFIL